MYSKVLIVFAVAALASANDLFLTSNHTDGLKPVFEGRFTSQWAITRQAKDVLVNATDIITRINVTDLRDGKDGEASIISGGVGHDNVTISLKSPAAFRGYDFFVQVFCDDDREVERGNRHIDEPVEIDPKTPEDTAKPHGVTEAGTSVTPTHITGLPTGTGNPEAATFPTVTGRPVTGLPTRKPVPVLPTDKATGVPKLMEVPEEDEEESNMHKQISFRPPRRQE